MALKAPEQVIRQALLDSSVVQALCGTRIYPVLAPSSTDLPFLVYRRASIGTVRTQALAGAVGGKSVNEYVCGRCNSRITFNFNEILNTNRLCDETICNCIT